jgi:hypothetical protein
LAVLGLGSLTVAPPSLAASAPLPRIVQSQPSEIFGGYFDDHSLAGDNHLAWDVSGTIEPLEVGFKTSVTNRGPGALQVCGVPSGTPGWMRSFQVDAAALGAACPPAVPANAKTGWFRYVTANHSDAVPAYFNRYHLMDFQRFALVPLPRAAGGPAGTPATAWDTDWGTCLNLGGAMMDCEQNIGAPAIATGIAPATTKLTQEGAPDAETIAIPGDARAQFPDGRYQVVAISNPYGLFREAGGARGSISCATVTLAGAPNYAPFTVTPVAGVPSSCYVPRTLIPALTGPGGRDPMAGTAPTAPPCPLVPTSGHCWATAPQSGPNPPARTAVTTANSVTKTDAVPVPRATSLKRYLATAIRHDFGRNITRRRVSCGQVALSGSTCTTRWRKGSASYSGRMFVRIVTSGRKVSWQYRTDVRKRQGGRTRAVRRGYRTGGSI